MMPWVVRPENQPPACEATKDRRSHLLGRRLRIKLRRLSTPAAVGRYSREAM